jgi:hypothetical protein
MKPLISALIVLSLAGCQTIRINGVEINRETQVLGGVLALAIATAIIIAENDSDSDPEKCAQFVSVPTDKGGFICAEKEG